MQYSTYLGQFVFVSALFLYSKMDVSLELHSKLWQSVNKQNIYAGHRALGEHEHWCCRSDLLH